MKENLKRIPCTGDVVPFFDDGKIRLSRLSAATVKRVIPHADAENILFPATVDEDGIITACFGYETPYDKTKSLMDIWKESVDNHRCTENFMVLPYSPGESWLHADDNDYFIECSIPTYDENTIWFARKADGGWFSLNIQNSWQGGRLDTECDMIMSIMESDNDEEYQKECDRIFEDEFRTYYDKIKCYMPYEQGRTQSENHN